MYMFRQVINKYILPGDFNTTGKQFVTTVIFKFSAMAEHLREVPLETCVKLK